MQKIIFSAADGAHYQVVSHSTVSCSWIIPRTSRLVYGNNTLLNSDNHCYIEPTM